MPFALICHDQADGLALRKATRQAHLDYIAQTGIVSQAGPCLDGEGRMIGSIVILDTEDREVAQNWANDDPYALAGLFARVEVLHWKKVVG